MEPFVATDALALFFADGLVFFTLGLVAHLAAHTFRASRLAITAALPWLGGFGLLVGTAKWGVIFIPLQAAYLSPVGVSWLQLLQGLLLVAGHACLLRFGLRLLSIWVPLRRLAPGAALLGATAMLTALALTRPELTLSVVLRSLSAYGLGLPGAILSAWGLLRQADLLADFYPRAARALRLSGAAFLLSAPLGPLAIPIDGNRLFTLGGVPVEAPLMLGGLFLTLALFGGLDSLRAESARRLERAERREALLEGRYRLAKELNDGAIQELTAAGMLVSAVAYDLPAESKPQARLVERQLQLVVERLRAYLMELEPMDWHEPDLYRGLPRLVAEFQANSLILVQVDLQPGLRLPPGRTQPLYGVVYEALANVRRHAGASQIWLTLRRAGGRWKLQVADDGAGFDHAQATGPGLERMAAGSQRAGGRLVVTRRGSGGTLVAVELPDGSLNGNTEVVADA